MLNSFTKKLTSFIFNPNDNTDVLGVGRKRKRPFGDREEEESCDVQITTVKRPKLHDEKSVFKSLFSSATVQSMSDWVQRKTPRLFGTSETTLGDAGDTKAYHPPAKTNGDTHHRFPIADVTRSYMSGIGSQNGNDIRQSLQRPPLHMNGSKSVSIPPSRGPKYELGMEGRGQRKKPSSFNDLFRSRNQHKFTAGESVRLEDKVRYQQLLQQFTTIPLETPTETHRPPTESIKHPISVPKLPRFYFTSNKSILGSQIPQEVVPEQRKPPDPDRSRRMIKVHPNHKSTPHAARNGGLSQDRSLVHITDISAIAPERQSRQDITQSKTVVDLTEDEPVIDITNDSVTRSKSPDHDFRNAKYLTEDWIKNLTGSYNSQARERQRKIAEEEMKAKLFDERRKAQEQDLETRIRQQMRIHAREPAVVEELPVEEIESEEEEEKEEEFIELTSEIEKKVNYCLRGGNSGEVLVDKFRLQITRGDIATLAGLNWLNDEVINFYMNLLMDRGEKGNFPKVHAFNTFFYPKIMSGGQSAVKRWTKRVDVLAVDYILVPVHLGMHWCLAVVNFKKKDIQYYDSMGGNNTQCLNALKKYLCDESLDKKKKDFDLNGWKTTIVKNIPQQMNGSDCGMFACKYAEYITRESQITFTQSNMPYFRRRMVYEIVTGQLLQ